MLHHHFAEVKMKTLPHLDRLEAEAQGQLSIVQ
jgi:hypothetical protein